MVGWPRWARGCSILCSSPRWARRPPLKAARSRGGWPVVRTRAVCHWGWCSRSPWMPASPLRPVLRVRRAGGRGSVSSMLRHWWSGPGAGGGLVLGAGAEAERTPVDQVTGRRARRPQHGPGRQGPAHRCCPLLSDRSHHRQCSHLRIGGRLPRWRVQALVRSAYGKGRVWMRWLGRSDLDRWACVAGLRGRGADGARARPCRWVPAAPRAGAGPVVVA